METSLKMTEKSIQDQVIEDLEARKQIGLENYGTLLYAKAHGKDMDQEAYEEALDLAIYLKCKIVEKQNG